MLRSMRSSVGSVFAKIILGLLVLSFVGWGVADYTFGGRAVNVAASVGDVEIPVSELSNSFQQEVARQGLDRNNPELLRQLGVAERALEGLVVRALYSAEAARLNVTAGDRAVRREIESRPEFRNQFQQFDRGLFQQYVRYAGGDEQAVVDSFRKDVARDYLIAAVASGAPAPPALVDAVTEYAGERRDITALAIPTVPASDIDPPGDAALRTYFEDNIETYRKPEYRKVSFIHLAPTALATDINLDEAMVQEAYQARQREFSKQETRHIQQLILPDAETEQRVRNLMAQGKTFAEAAQEAANVAEDALDLGTLTQNAIPDAALAEAAFTTPEGGVSDPVDGVFGQSIVHVVSVEEGSVMPLDEVRERIEADLKLDQAIGLSYDLSKQLDDALGDGLSLEDAGQAIGVPVKTVAVMDPTGAGPDGTAIEDIPADRAFLTTAFDSPLDETSFLTEGENDSFFVLRVDGVTETRLPELDEVKTSVTADWISERRAEATEAKAAELAKRMTPAADFDALAKIEGFTVLSIADMARNGRAANNTALPAELAKTIFGLSTGEITHGAGPSGAFVARLEKITPAEEFLGEEMKAQITERLAVSATTSLIEQLSISLRRKHEIDVNPNAIEYVIDPTGYNQAVN